MCLNPFRTIGSAVAALLTLYYYYFIKVYFNELIVNCGNAAVFHHPLLVTVAVPRILLFVLFPRRHYRHRPEFDGTMSLLSLQGQPGCGLGGPGKEVGMLLIKFDKEAGLNYARRQKR